LNYTSIRIVKMKLCFCSIALSSIHQLTLKSVSVQQMLNYDGGDELYKKPDRILCFSPILPCFLDPAGRRTHFWRSKELTMECSIDVFVGNSMFLDADIYQLWVDGYAAHEAADALQRRGILQVPQLT